MRIRNKPTYIRIVSEKPKKKSKLSFGKTLYFTFLIFLFVFLFVKFTKKFVYIKGYGQIKIAKLRVQEITDIRVLKLLVKEGDVVEVGNPLFSFVRGTKFQLESPVMSEENLANKIPYKTKLKKPSLNLLSKKIKKREIEVKKLERETEKLNKLLIEKKELYKLKLAKKSEITSIENKIKKIEVKIESLKTELENLKKEFSQNYYLEIKKLKKNPLKSLKIYVTLKDYPERSVLIIEGNKRFFFNLVKIVKGISFTTYERYKLNLVKKSNFFTDFRLTKSAGSSGFMAKTEGNFEVESCYNLAEKHKIIITIKKTQKSISEIKGLSCENISGEIFYSPFSGMVTRIYFDSYEVALKGQKIMDIFQPTGVRIKAFFEQKDLKYIKKGKEVLIEFPDGEKIKGRISRFYFASLALPPEFQKKYEPLHRSIAVDVIPFDLESLINRQIDKMSVVVWLKK